MTTPSGSSRSAWPVTGSMGRAALSGLPALQSATSGRAWWSLADIAVSASLLYGIKEPEWSLDRRMTDY